MSFAWIRKLDKIKSCLECGKDLENGEPNENGVYSTGFYLRTVPLDLMGKLDRRAFRFCSFECKREYFEKREIPIEVLHKR